MAIKADFSISVHPGEVLSDMIAGVGMTQAAFARHLKLEPSKLNEIVRGKRGVSAAMAVRLGRAFAHFGSTPGFWLNLQNNYELSLVKPNVAEGVVPIRKRA